jgi:hypothetical protein
MLLHARLFVDTFLKTEQEFLEVTYDVHFPPDASHDVPSEK